MSGISILVDTNVLINLAEGKDHIDRYLQGNLLYVSVITEIELLGHPNISAKEIRFF